MNDILTMLADLAELHATEARLRAAQAEAYDESLTPKVRAEHARIGKRYGPQLEALATAIELLTSRVKTAVLTHAQSVKGADLHAIYVSGKPSWDDRALAGYAVVHPEVLPFRTLGAPSVTLRKVS